MSLQKETPQNPVSVQQAEEGLLLWSLFFVIFVGKVWSKNSCVCLAAWTIEKFMQLLSWNVFDSFQF